MLLIKHISSSYEAWPDLDRAFSFFSQFINLSEPSFPSCHRGMLRRLFGSLRAPYSGAMSQCRDLEIYSWSYWGTELTEANILIYTHI